MGHGRTDDARKGPDVSGHVTIADLLEPVLRAAEAEEAELAWAVTLVAEAMAVLGITVTAGRNRVLSGLSDEKAVLHLLRRHRQMLVYEGRMEEALLLRDLARRIERMDAGWLH